MARQPEVFVRELEPAELQRLVKITRTARDRVRLRRAGIVLASVQGRSAADAAAMFIGTAQYAREVIGAFNELGFAALDPKWSGGRPPRFCARARELICRVARTPPQQAGRPFTTWSLTKLVEHLREEHRIVASTETVRQVLRSAGVRWQATKTWKASRDPGFTAKMTRILALYDQAAAGRIPDGGRVICVDEFGPLNLQPRPGRGWFPSGRPARQRATYHRTGGVRHMLAALDLASGQMFYRFRDRKRWQEFAAFPRQVRTRFPTGRLFVVCDNFSPHRKAEVADWCATADVELVFTPTNASWLGQRILVDDVHRFDSVKVTGVDEYVWRHTRRGDRYVTVVIDLTPIRDKTGPSRLLDMVEGRSKQAFKAWLAARPQAWRDGLEVVAMDGFTCFKTATREELPDAVAVMDPFHVVRLSADALNRCRRRV